MAARHSEHIAADPNWGQYLNARSQLVTELANQVRRNAAAEAPAWAAKLHAHMPADLIADIQVWRAATQVDPSDPRPTGPPQYGRADRIVQQQLDKRLAAADARTEWQWRQLLAAAAPSAIADPFLPELPDDHPAAALWWRILDQSPQNAESETRNPKGCPSDQAHALDGARAALEAASGVRPQPLTRPPDRVETPG